MLQELAAVGDGAINLASGIGDASVALAKDVNMMSPLSNDTISQMASEMTKTPSIANFLMKCPLSFMNA